MLDPTSWPNRDKEDRPSTCILGTRPELSSTEALIVLELGATPCRTACDFGLFRPTRTQKQLP